MTDKFAEFYKSIFIKRVFIYGTIILLAYELRSFANLFLLLFFVTYIMNELCRFIHSHVSRFVKISEELVIMATYFFLITLLVMSGIKYIPEVINEAKELTKSFDASQDLNVSINSYLGNILNSIDPSLKNILEYYNFNYAKEINEFSSNIAAFSYSFLKSIGNWMFNIFLMIVLSLFFLIEKNKVKHFAEVFKDSKLSFMYHDLQPVFTRFYGSFGVMIRSQFIISLINTTLTVLALAFLGFSKLFALGLMIFLFGLIPVAGAILSSIPLILIGFSMHGIVYVFYIIGIVIFIHILEAYILNPRIFSSLTHLPVFVTLVVLLISEHIMGPWGLVYGLPLFVFIIESIKHPPVTNGTPSSSKTSKNIKPGSSV